MQLTQHQYDNKPSRYYIDGKRVSGDTYDLTIIKARIAGKHQCSFITKRAGSPRGTNHYVHYSCI